MVLVAQQQEAAALTVMMKGKRTKRPRPLSPPLALVADEEDVSSEWAGARPTTTTYSTEEEEDMAHCLILLAQGSNPNNNNNNNKVIMPITPPNKPNNNNNNTSNSNSNSNNNNGSSSYECKTCNRAFPSFQALGGHRASHKKPKLSIAVPDHQAKKSSLIFSLLNESHNYDGQYNEDEIGLSLRIATNNSNSNSNSNNNNNNKAKVHECGICGAEFSSGQALGGHMRRHRPIGGTPTSIPSPSQSVSIANGSPQNNISGVNEKTRNLLSLDLNLPAPEEDHQRRDPKFVFSSNEKTLVFSASSLVDCHY